MSNTAQQLREALGKMTGGRWFYDGMCYLFTELPKMGDQMLADGHCEDEEGFRIRGVGANLPLKDNAEGIALMHNLLPALLDEYEKLKQKVRVLNGTLVLTDLQLKDAEREAAAGRVLAKLIDEINMDIECDNALHSALAKMVSDRWNGQKYLAIAAYRTACGKDS